MQKVSQVSVIKDAINQVMSNKGLEVVSGTLKSKFTKEMRKEVTELALSKFNDPESNVTMRKSRSGKDLKNYVRLTLANVLNKDAKLG